MERKVREGFLQGFSEPLRGDVGRVGESSPPGGAAGEAADGEGGRTSIKAGAGAGGTERCCRRLGWFALDSVVGTWIPRTVGGMRRQPQEQQGGQHAAVWESDLGEDRTQVLHTKQGPFWCQVVSVPELAVGPGGVPRLSPGILTLLRGW